MSARERLADMIRTDRGDMNVYSEPEVRTALDTYRAEVIAADRHAHDGELAMLRGLVRTLRVVVRDDSSAEAQRAAVRRLLHEHAADDAAARAQEKSSPTGADATPGLTDRQTRLLDAIRMHGGEWTTRRVLHLFALTDPGVVQRGMARRDLAVLHRAGHLVLVDDPDKRHYALNSRKEGRS